MISDDRPTSRAGAARLLSAMAPLPPRAVRRTATTLRTLALAAAPIALLAGIATIPAASPAQAQDNLRILRGIANRALDVPMNRAIVVESDVPFAELSIANPNIADISTLSDRTFYLLGKAPGRTTLTAFGADGALINNVEVRVAPDVAEFKERLLQILPGERIDVRTANDGIVLSGTVSSAVKLDRALELAQRYAPERVSNLMSVGGTQQVMLKVRFAEMSRSVSKALNGGLTYDSGDVVLGGGGGGLASVPVEGQAVNGIASVFALAGDAIGATVFGLDVGSSRLNLLLEALENKGVVRTLAEPNLTALSGQEASFLAGGEFPIPVAQEDDVLTIEFKPFGIELEFIPRVVDGDVINLELAAAVSSVDASQGFTQDALTIPAFTRRDAKTTVEMRDGESFAIAGLLSEDFSDTVSQVPFLGDLPVLGALFRSSAFQKEQTELVIIVTAHLVNPVRGDVYALPTDRVVIPSERQLFLNGRVEGRPARGAVAEVARQDFSGSYGYVLD